MKENTHGNAKKKILSRVEHSKMFAKDITVIIIARERTSP